MTQSTESSHQSIPVIPAKLAVIAMQDSGYKNTAYALAEIIDNSVQAKANEVDVICVEEAITVNDRTRGRLAEIAVVDNGIGMEPYVLQWALQFGNGTHLDDRLGIGRFGMGLPNSSISQCKRVDVWTWKSGPDNAIHGYLDVDEIVKGEEGVKFPTPSPLPDKWRRRSSVPNTSGTLVVWSKLEDHRVTWRGARTTLNHTEVIIGRMYRHFINQGQLTVGLRAFNEQGMTIERQAKVNDPLYLMPASSTPPPFDSEPMFQPWGEGDEIFTIKYAEKRHEVRVRMSWARSEARTGDNSGARPHGRHAAKNLGVSIVRADRELDIDSSWTNSYDPTERWWGAEISFPPTLDEVFGVTNSKQSATIFSGLAQFDWSSEAEPGESITDFQQRIREEGDPRSYLIPIAQHIKDQIAVVREKLRQQTRGTRGGRNRHQQEFTVADVASQRYRDRANQGYVTSADQEEFTENDRDALEEDLRTDKRYSQEVAALIADGVLHRNRKVEFLTKAMDGYAFFDVEHHHGGLTTVVFNTNHPMYNTLVRSLNPEIEDETDSQLLDRINTASDTLQLLFAAWARYHLEDANARDSLYDVRQQWGQMARAMLSEST